jgi:hypothetical protein
MFGGPGHIIGKMYLSSSVSLSAIAKCGLAEGLLGTTSVSSIAGSLLVSGLGSLGNVRGGIISSNGGSIRGGIAGLGTVGCSLTLSSYVIVKAVQALSLSTVKVKPPIADEIVLVEDGAIGAQEAVLGESTLSVGSANVEHLALSLRVSIVASIHLTVANKTCFWGFSIDGVVFTRNARDSLLQHGKAVITSWAVGLILALGTGIIDRLVFAGAGISHIRWGRISAVITATTWPLATASALGCGYSKKDKS